jgi:hypothetical protein
MVGKLLGRIVFIFLCFSISVVHLEAQSKLTMTLSSDSLTVNNYIILKYTVYGTDIAFQNPDLTDWNVVSGPNTSQQMSIMNGKVSKSMSVQFTILMDKVGDFVLPSCFVTYQDKAIDIPITKVIVQPSTPLSEEGKIAKLREKIITIDVNEGSVEKKDKTKVVRQLKKI